MITLEENIIVGVSCSCYASYQNETIFSQYF